MLPFKFPILNSTIYCCCLNLTLHFSLFVYILHSKTYSDRKLKKKESGNIKIKIKIVFKKSVKKISDEYNICFMQIMKPSFLSGSPIFKTLSHKGLLQCRICPCLLCWNDAPGATLMVTLQAQQQHDEMHRAVCLPRYVYPSRVPVRLTPHKRQLEFLSRSKATFPL